MFRHEVVRLVHQARPRSGHHSGAVTELPAQLSESLAPSSRQGGSTAAEPLFEGLYSNKCVKRGANVPTNTDGTIHWRNTVMNRWFSQCGQSKQMSSQTSGKVISTHTEYSITPTPALRDLPADPSVHSAPKTPSLRRPNNTTPVVSGSQVKPGAIPLKVTTNSNDAPPSSPRLASLQGAPSQSAEVHEPRPSAISEGAWDLLIWTLIIQLPFRLGFRVQSLLLYQAGSLNPSRRH